MTATQLTIRLTRNEDGWWTAQIAELPGAISQAKDAGTAAVNVITALRDLQPDDRP